MVSNNFPRTSIKGEKKSEQKDPVALEVAPREGGNKHREWSTHPSHPIPSHPRPMYQVSKD